MLYLSFNTPLLSAASQKHMWHPAALTAIIWESPHQWQPFYPTTTLHFCSQGHLITLWIQRANEYHTPNKKNEVQSIDNDFDFSSCLWSCKRLPVTHSLFQPDEVFITHHPPRTSGWQGIKIHHHPLLGYRLYKSITLWHSTHTALFVLQTWMIPQILQLGEEGVCFSKQLVYFLSLVINWSEYPIYLHWAIL